MHLEVVGRLDATLELAPGKSVPPEKFVLAGTRGCGEADDGTRDVGAFRVEFGAPQGRTSEEGSRFSAIVCFPRSGRAAERPLRSIAR
jgi:hypothetical protein